MGIRKDTIYLPVEPLWEESGWETKGYRINVDCFKHKTYPRCTKCNDKYVPIKKGDTECFKCQFIKK